MSGLFSGWKESLAVNLRTTIRAALSSTAHRCLSLFDRLRGPRLSDTREKWRVAGFVGVAVVVHLAAIALGFLHFEQPIETIGFAGTIETSVEMTVALEESTIPPDLDTPVLPPTLPEEYLFTEVNPSPPPVRQTVTKPIAKPRSGAAGSPTLSSARALALSAPWPTYPSAARQNGITGDGVALMMIDPRRGSVTHVSMLKSTGDSSLDDAAVRSFRRWRFRPGSISRLKAPVTFRLTAQLE
jgi:TonB family protein